VAVEVSVEKPKSHVYIVCIGLLGFCHWNGPWPVLTVMGLISGPPRFHRAISGGRLFYNNHLR